MLRKLVTAVAVFFIYSSAQASEKVMLVLDVSGSMWGQIKGVTKIEIARDALSSLVANWQDGREVGLVAYGHREKGNCKDIEVVVPVGPLDAAAMNAMVAKLKPKGKTPLSASVKVAAEALKYTEDKATVVLISDGRETCEMDPCALGTQLEESGVDFTAHVIGFDVKKVEDQVGLRCLAENTGGRFIAADDAGELVQALEQTARAPEPEPLPEASLSAPESVIKGTEFETMPDAMPGLDGYVYLFRQGAEKPETYAYVREASNAAYEAIVMRMPALAGDYELRWLLKDKRVIATRPITATEPEILLQTTEQATAGTEIEITMEAPRGLSGYIYLYAAGRDKSIAYAYAREGKTTNYEPAVIRLPAEPGDYVLKWISKDKQLYAETAVVAEQAVVSLQAPAEVMAGTEVEITLVAPEGLGGYIYLYPEGREKSIAYAYVREGKTGGYEISKIHVPATAGNYTLRWISPKKEVLTETSLLVVEAQVSLQAPESAAMGTEIDVVINAPEGMDGTIKLLANGRKKHFSYAYVRPGKSGGYQVAKIRLPVAPGDYVLRWVSNRKEVITERPIEVAAAEVKLAAPAEAVMASEIEINFNAPAGLDGQVQLFVPGRKKYLTYAYVKEGTTSDYKSATMRVAGVPGDYVIRWMSAKNELLAEAPIRIVTADFSLGAQDQVVAGEQFEVIVNAPPGLAGHVHIQSSATGKSLTYRGVREGATGYNPVKLKAPKQPGDYLLKWMTKRKEPLAERPIRIVE